MPTFGKRSKKNLSECHKDLQRLFNEIIKHYDCSVICGYRGEVAQNEAYFNGSSGLKFPNSNHNKTPSMAVDVVPYFKNKPHIRWKDKEKFYEFIGFVKGTASTMNIEIKSGNDWDNDGDLHDQTFFDLPHFELV